MVTGIGEHLSCIELSDRYGMKLRGRESDVSTAAVASVKRAASHGMPNHPARGGTQDKRRHATAPGKPRLTSVAKGIASPAIVRLARRAGYQETGSSSSTEAHQSNPARFVGETSNPDVLSDAILRPADERGRCGNSLLSLLNEAAIDQSG